MALWYVKQAGRWKYARIGFLRRAACAAPGWSRLEKLPLLPDLQHELAARVAILDLRQRLASLIQRQYRRDLDAVRRR